MSLTAPPSGKQSVLRRGAQTVVITEIGGGEHQLPLSEPAAPDASNSGDGLITLEPGQTHVASWGLRSVTP